MATPPTHAQLDELFDRLWNDERRRDDRSQFSECEFCARPLRWVVNIGSRRGSSMQIVARPVTTSMFFDPTTHHGLVAVFTDRTGFTVSRFTTVDEVEGAFLYQCHWDVCEDAARVRDRLHRDRYGTYSMDDDLASAPDSVHRYEQWLRGRRDG